LKTKYLYITFWAAALAVAIVVATLLIGIYDRSNAGPEPILFEVHKGESLSSVVERLADARLVDHPELVRLYALLNRYDRYVKVGTYRLAYGERAKNILGKVVRGDVHKVAVTIPEGLFSHEIAAVLANEARVDSAGFMAVVADPEIRQRLDVEGPSLEGYLFPDTYWVPWNAAPAWAAYTMVTRFHEIFDEAARRRAAQIGMTPHEVVTLASIVEAETRLEAELPLVSAVYHNRLRKGMRLEADPTVAFAMGGYRGRLFYRDLEIDSPYNTYKNSGLPPGPICSPGAAAINAALYPDTTSKAIYFVAQGDGGHIFSRTLSEHQDAVRNVRRARRTERSGNP
jgi:UPF0755 protein